jgi:hypothetical protein
MIRNPRRVIRLGFDSVSKGVAMERYSPAVPEEA